MKNSLSSCLWLLAGLLVIWPFWQWGLGQAMQHMVARLRFECAQEIVGRSDLLQQISHFEKIDLSAMLIPVDEYLNSKPIPVELPMHEMALIDRGPLHRPRNHLTTVISNLVMESFTNYKPDDANTEALKAEGHRRN